MVDNEYCVGCGLCEKACITEEAAIRVLPRKFVLGRAGAHYVKGWDKEDENRLKGVGTQKRLDNDKAKNYLNEGDLP